MEISKLPNMDLFEKYNCRYDLREKKGADGMTRKYKRIRFSDRQQIETMYNSGVKPEYMAERIGVCVATIYRELERGKTITEDGGERYTAEKAQKSLM